MHPHSNLTDKRNSLATLNKTAMKNRHAIAHMQSALVYAHLSHCERLKVGCVIVKDDEILSNGWNGTPPGWDNCCEDEHNVSKPEVRHAEYNAIMKLTRSTRSGEGASVFVTVSPCFVCADMLVSMKVKEVYYIESYRSDAGITHLLDHGIRVIHMPVSITTDTIPDVSLDSVR